MYKSFTLPLKSAIVSLSALFILAACGGLTIDLNLPPEKNNCLANPFQAECDGEANIGTWRATVIKNCEANPNNADSEICIAADIWVDPSNDDENIAETTDEDVVAITPTDAITPKDTNTLKDANTPKDANIKPEFDTDSFTKPDDEKSANTSLEIVDLCSDPATAGNERCTPTVVACINHPFSGRCQGDNVLGNFVKGGVTLSKTVVLQDKRARDCRDGIIDSGQCQILNSEKQRCTGAAFSDASCSAVTYSVCKADVFDPLCSGKAEFTSVYFNERSEVCFEDPNNPNCTGTGGHIDVVCSEYPFDRLCTGNTNYDDARATACETDPTVSSDCPVAPVVDVCLDNPFGPTCADSGYNNARKDLAKTCAIQAVTGAVTSACDTIITEALPCFIDPFDTVCDSNPAVKTYIAQLRSTRVAFCNSNLRIASLCTGAPVAKSVCRFDPFDTVCLGDRDFAGNRLSACRDGSTNTQCGNIIAGVCRDDPFDPLCGNGYTGERETACRNGSTNTQCGGIITGVCGNNPFDSLCGSNYDGNRERACASNPNSSRCRDTLTRVCGGNPFSRLCRNTQSYLDTRVSICRGNPLDGRCGWTISSICNNDPFDTVCPESGWNNARETACRNGSASTRQCGNIITGVCGNNPFDTLCGNGYTNARETACRNGSTSSQCGGIIAGVCGNNPFDPLCGSGYTQSRRSLCLGDPFAPRCAGEGYNDLRVTFCENNAGTHPSCPAPEPTITEVATPQVTAGVWADSFDEDLSHGVTADDTKSQFLIGRETDLDTGGVDSLSTKLNYSGNLNLGDAIFNGTTLGGNTADGVAFFAAGYNNNGRLYSYAGILENTNLGAPLADTAGSAKWIGSFSKEGSYPTDFVLNIAFGTGVGAGEIEALVQNYGYSTHLHDFHVKGEFDDTGVITGAVHRGNFKTNDPNNRGYVLSTGTLTGIIGEEGAVGAFLLGNTFGGFVARPSSTDELQGLAKTCAADPFHEHCNVGYESERVARLEHCIIGGNANDASCRSAKGSYPCINNPFKSGCDDYFSQYYQQARINRVAFCRTEGNGGNGLCTVTETFSHICTNHPFTTQCLGDSDYNQARKDACTTAGTGSTECRTLAGITCSNDPFSSYCGGAYNNARAAACIANPGQSRCRDTVERVCNGNPFDTLCRNTTVYLNARKTHCRSTWNDPRCPATIRAVCGVDPFDRMCNSVYDRPREIACRAGTATTRQCGTTVAGICSGNPFDPLCGNGYTQNRRSLCTDNPFAPRCAGEGYDDLRVSFCEGKAGNHPSCPAPQVTAEVWADSFDEDLAHGASADDTESQFLIGKETDLDTGGGSLFIGRQYSLNLADATFNGVALGGDRADGVAYFQRNVDYLHYGGILSGTNLGAPLTQKQGSAKWLGALTELGHIDYNYDFILNITFGGTDKAGSIEALVQTGNNHQYITGDFDDAGVITGRVDHGNAGRIFERSIIHTADLTGLIGEEGAVGVFWGGGFVARPSSTDELQTVEQTCSDNPFNRLCGLGYESERVERIEQCITGGNANNSALCGNVVELFDCINNPFGYCEFPFSPYYRQARTNRVDFCRTAGNAGNALCTVEATFAHICTNYPFDAQCRGNNDYRPIRRNACLGDPFAPRCTGDVYNDLRVTFCEGKVGTHSSCPAPQVTASVWADSFDTPLSHVASRDDTDSKFLIGRETDLNGGGVRFFGAPVNLNLADATFNGVALGGDRADGVAFLTSGYANDKRFYNYSGILSGTNLGAPLTDITGSAKWIGSFQYRKYSPQDFILNISFGTGDGAGEIEAIILKDFWRSFDEYHIAGEFDDAGVITGTVREGDFRTTNTDDRQTTEDTGKLTGLIGEEGAVGAFIMDGCCGVGGDHGGFVARPSSAEELRTVEQTCTDDPFNKLCALGYESQRNARVEHCIIGGNAADDICYSVSQLHPCTRNPFRSHCDDYMSEHNNSWSRYYQQARVNRVAFCRTSGNADNGLCTVTETFAHICRNHPFDAQCRGNNDYRTIRRDACLGDPFATRCAGNVYNDLRVSFCARNAGNPSCPRPVVPDTTPNRVTAADWVASFDEDLPVRRRLPTNGRIGYPYTGENHFVKASETGLDLTNYIRATHRVITFANVTFDGKAVGGDAADGFALSFNSYAQHVGILSGTDLGAPFTQRQGSVSWNARMVVLANKSEAVVGDFILHINFGAGDQAGTITGQAIAKRYGVRDHRSADYKYKVDGTFDDSGVIRGTSQYGNFNYEDTKIPRYWRNSGTLTGLIGEEGAIGVFISNTGGYTGYVGGFIATPTLQNYVSSGDLSDYYHLPWPTDPLYRNETSSFLAASSTGEMNTGTLLTRDGDTPTVETLTLANATYQGRSLGGDATDGVAFFKGWKGPTDTTRSTKIHYRVYSGIFDDINLGAPVTQTSGKAYWKGQFKSVHFDRVVSKDFTLKVTFYEGLGTRTAGRVDALVHDTGLKHFAVSAVFNNRGVIDGNILFGDYENNDRTEPYLSYQRADLVGLIGQEGAIAIFKNTAPSPSSRGRPRELEFAGGFVAVPNLPDAPVVPAPDTTPNRVTAADWVASFDGTLGKTPAPDDTSAEFLEGNADGLDTGTLSGDLYKQRDIKMNILNFDTATFEGKYLNGDATDGVAFFNGVRIKGEGIERSRRHNYAGILSTTDLGAPLNQTGRATWHGSINIRGFSAEEIDFSLDIAFNGTQGGTLSAFIANTYLNIFIGNPVYHLKLTGAFDANGVITGTTDEGVFVNGNPNKPRQPRWDGDERTVGVLTGLIGQKGAVGAFYSGGNVGGFVARPSEAFASPEPLVNNARVTTADWLESFDVALSAAPNYTPEGSTEEAISGLNRNPVDPNEFLKGAKTGMSVRNTNGITYEALTLADSTLDGQSLGGDAADGLAIARNRYLGSHYASILSGTDLGAPLTQSQGTVNWYGTFRVFGWHHVDSDFELRINFGAGDSAGTLNAFVGSDHINTYHYRVNGVFDDNGVITGAVELGNFGGQDAALPTYGRKSGELRGLIGEEGAIGVFIGDDNNYNGFAGGFVATPDLTSVVLPAAPVADTSPNRVTTSDWLESFDVAPSPSLDGNPNTRFIENAEEGARSVVNSNLGSLIAFAPIVYTEPESIKQGAQFASSNDGKYVHFAGILANTDLGAPLISSNVPVYWNGSFGATLPYRIEKDLVLKVSFNSGAGEVEAFVKDSGNLYYHLKGGFDNKGVIKGTVKYGDISDRNNNPSRRGVLSGLIGQEGAIGVFVANINNGFGDYSGAFIARSSSVASPTTTPTPATDTTPNRVTVDDWLAGFDTMPSTTPSTLPTTNPQFHNEFLQSTSGTLNTGGIVRYAGTSAAPNISNLTLADTAFGSNRGDAADGIAMFRGNSRRYNYAGILSGTDLGAPVTQTDGTAEWEGRFQTTNMDAKDFTLEIDFGNREVVAFVSHSSDSSYGYYHMTGTFDRNGLMKGTVDYRYFTGGDRTRPSAISRLGPAAEMRGLIGQEGAVGVFISDADYRSYSGGFVARPPSE